MSRLGRRLLTSAIALAALLMSVPGFAQTDLPGSGREVVIPFVERGPSRNDWDGYPGVYRPYYRYYSPYSALPNGYPYGHYGYVYPGGYYTYPGYYYGSSYYYPYYSANPYTSAYRGGLVVAPYGVYW
jgi:hypothetical protein